jgi:hypothetical protein
METEVLLGVTTCPTCQKRFRVSKKYESFIGKSIQCPKCKRPFVIKLESPAPIEQAAMATSSVAETNGEAPAEAPPEAAGTPKRKKRTKAEIRKAIYKKIKKEFGPFLKQLEAIAECENYSEEKVRVWCIGVLQNVLGYDDSDLDFELSAGNKKIDIAIKHEDSVVLIIECKRKTSLQETARKQAIDYAMTRSADWAVVTNGRTWELHRVIPVKGQNPRTVEVFNIALLDDDGLSNYDVERMYLLTKRALLRRETEKEFHRAQYFDKNNIFDAMLSDRVTRAIRRALTLDYKKKHKVHVGPTVEEVRDELKELIRPEEL